VPKDFGKIMEIKIEETCVSCSICKRPLNPLTGPAERKESVMQATVLRNSLMAREVVLAELLKNKQLATSQMTELNSVREELSQINQFLLTHDPWWVR